MNSRSDSFIVIGDTQRTSFLEKLILRREINDTEREILFEDIGRKNPSFLVIVGDLVANGLSKQEWKYFFSLVSGLQVLDISIYPAKGNHDFNIEKYFSDLKSQSWYSKIIQSLGLIWLDTTDHSSRQRVWFENQLKVMDANPKIQNVIVFGHHPPFTKSPVVSPSQYVRKAFLPGFKSSIKTCAFISGHSHGFERFEDHGKTFIVTGGGGGPRPKSTLYPFHYLKLTPNVRGLRIDVYGLQKTEVGSRHLSSFFLEGGTC